MDKVHGLFPGLEARRQTPCLRPGRQRLHNRRQAD